MASRAVAKMRVDWSKVASQLDKMETPKLNRLKSQIDSTAVKVASLPESLPSIDWAHYKAHASDPKMVEELEKKYSSIKLEAPKAPAARLDDLQRAKQHDEARFSRFQKIAESYIASAIEVRGKFENMIPVPDMTMEDYTLTFPEWNITVDNPSLFPHLGRTPGLSREEAIAFEQPDPEPYATKTAWKDWEERKKKFYSD